MSAGIKIRGTNAASESSDVMGRGWTGNPANRPAPEDSVKISMLSALARYYNFLLYFVHFGNGIRFQD